MASISVKLSLSSLPNSLSLKPKPPSITNPPQSLAAPLWAGNHCLRASTKDPATVFDEESDVGLNRSPVTVSGAPVEEGKGSFPAGLRRESMPDHVAVIMDGNRRWARMRGLPEGSGYQAGVRALRSVVDLCPKLGIRVLTVFAFSSENWFRPKVEVDFLIALFESGLKEELDNFMREDIRFSVIGDLSKFPDSLQKLIMNVEETTKNNARFHLVVAVSYSGQYDIVQACQNIALKVQDGLIEPEDVNEFMIEHELKTNCTRFPCPDLLIRTGGELRVSNFFLWQLAYTELFFAKSYWPDFGEADLVEALLSFQQRKRRYGVHDF